MGASGIVPQGAASLRNPTGPAGTAGTDSPPGVPSVPTGPRSCQPSPADSSKIFGLLAEVKGAGITLIVLDGRVVVRCVQRPPEDILVRLRACKAHLLGHLTGQHCRCCGEPMPWPAPGLAFADGTAAHIPCYERSETVRV